MKTTVIATIIASAFATTANAGILDSIHEAMGNIHPLQQEQVQQDSKALQLHQGDMKKIASIRSAAQQSSGNTYNIVANPNAGQMGGHGHNKVATSVRTDLGQQAAILAQSNQGKVAALTGRVDAVETHQDLTDMRITDNSKRITEIEASSNQDQVDMNTADNQFNAENIGANTALIKGNTVRAVDAQNSADQAKEMATSASNYAATANQRALDNTQRVNTLESETAALVVVDGVQDVAIAANRYDITGNTNAINAETARAQGQEQSIRKDVAHNSARIADNTAAINKNSADIVDLRSDLERQAKQVAGVGAMSMANANLVQPYSVGKFAMSAAVGGYDGESAVAVGTGYRFNEHLTVKASMAYETGTENLGVGAGVGYEW